ncbi:hypothetical protein ACFVHQ_17535 [Actinomycetes bacterium NPDC127524]
MMLVLLSSCCSFLADYKIMLAKSLAVMVWFERNKYIGVSSCV